MVQAWVHKKKFTAGFWIHRYARVHACLNRQKPIYTSKEHGITARKFTTGRSGTFRGSKSLHCVTVERMLGKGNTAKIRNKRQGSDENHQYLSALLDWHVRDCWTSQPSLLSFRTCQVQHACKLKVKKASKDDLRTEHSLLLSCDDSTWRAIHLLQYRKKKAWPLLQPCKV